MAKKATAAAKHRKLVHAIEMSDRKARQRSLIVRGLTPAEIGRFRWLVFHSGACVEYVATTLDYFALAVQAIEHIRGKRAKVVMVATSRGESVTLEVLQP